MKNFFKRIFANQDINTQRQIEVDIAKAICIIGMIFVHAFEQLPMAQGSGGAGEFILLRILNTLFGATTFMFCMGFGMSYTKKNSPKNLIIRGAIIFGLGILLNFLRTVVAELIINGIHPGTFSNNFLIGNLLSNDIMLFAGLAMMLFGLLKKIKTPLWGIASVAITMSILGTIFKGYHIDNIWLNCICGWFIGMLDSTLMDTFSNFPLFNWFIMVVAGYAFAELFKKVKDKKLFYLAFSSISLVAVCLYCVFGIPNHIGVFGESFVCTYHITIFDALISICGAVFALGVYYFVSRILPKFVLSFATMLSKNINTIYCIQWIIYGNVPVILYAFANEFTFDVGYVLLIAVGVLIFSVVIAWAYKKVLAILVNKKTKTESAEVN